MQLGSIDDVLNSEQHKRFIREVINEYSLESIRRSRGLRKTVDIPIIVVYKLGSRFKTGVIRSLKSRISRKDCSTWLYAAITIDGRSSLYEVPLCKNNEVLDKAGLHSDGYMFCITSVEYGLCKEPYTPESSPSTEFYYIRQMVEEVNSEDYSSIERIAEAMMNYVERHK